MTELESLNTLSADDKRELLKNLLSLRSGNASKQFPLSYGQQSLWFVYQLAPSSPAYNFLYAVRVPGSLDHAAFTRACQTLVERHAALRTRFAVQDNKPVQVVEDRPDVDVPVINAAGLTDDQLLERIRARADEPFDLAKPLAVRIELYQKSTDEHVLLLVFHHIIADLWSADLLVQEMKQLYQDERGRRKPSLPQLPEQFADYVRWQTMTVHGKRGQKSLAYWQDVLAGELPVLDLPTDRPRPPVQTYKGTSYSWRLDDRVANKLRTLVKENQATPFIGLLSAYQLLLHRLSGQDDLLVGTALAERSRPEWERIVGYFLNQVVLRANFSTDQTYRQLIERTRTMVHEALDHQDCPFGLLVKKLQPRRDPSRSPIFQTMFIWDKPRDLEPAATSSNGNTLRLEPLIMEQRGAPFDLTFIIFEIGDKLTASFRYNSDLFDAATIERMAGNFDTLLQSVLENPDRPLSQTAILTARERQQLLIDWNHTQAPWSRESCFHDLFEQLAAQAPQAPAVLFEDQTLSYAELNARANQLARYLGTLGVQRGDAVAISLPRGPDIVVSVLAAWKAGAAYMFLDPAYPPKRLIGMVRDAQPAALIAPAQVPDLPLPTVQLPADWPAIGRQADANLNLPRSPEDIAYLIYTSGSTGRPKGIVLRHRGLCAMAAANRAFGVQASDRVLQFASFSFDASVWEVTQALLTGASLVMGTQGSMLPGPGFVRLIDEKKATVALLPPSVLAALPPESLPSLRILHVGGESCSAEVATAWAPGRHLFNLYGPTEATVYSTSKRVVPNGKAPPIGKPIANVRVYVLDRWLQPVPVGVSGELYLAGPTLALGYLNQPEATAERFLPNPFDAADGGVLYRTGDLVRWNREGELEFLGRKDFQIKIRGYRIELEEIQEVLRRHPEVADAVVITREGKDRQPTLVGYVVPKSMATFPMAEVRAYLRERLPHYMLPSAIMPLEALPLSVNGKVDRNRLPVPSADATSADRQVVPPRDEAERLLWDAWKQVLGLNNFGVHDNFFDLGGASIQTLEVVSLANARGFSLTPEMLFRYQTVADLAAACGPINGVASKAQVEVSPAPATVLARPEAEPETTVQLPGAIVESMGVYLPSRSVSTPEIIQGCRAKLDFPLERLTGIRSRRMVGEGEYSIDMAEKAAAECLRRSRHRPEDIDLLVCCNISRADGPNFRFGMEPSTAARIRQRFGLVNALAFDITNACAGTFTALNMVDTLLRHGAIARAMVVSGEYITHLTTAAQFEIQNFMDSRLACLTLGDSGAAMILEQAPSTDVGFQEIELFTLGRYHNLCVAKISSEAYSGAMMYTDPVKATAVAIKQEVKHAVEVLRRNHWDPETIDALIMHQTSETTLDGAVREINRAFGKEVCHRGNTIYNVAERGNMATNTHAVALWERIQAGDIEPGDRTFFAVSGSGQTVGAALYIFDDLPERLRRQTDRPEPVRPEQTGELRVCRLSQPVRIESIGTIGECVQQPADTVAMIREAGEQCLQKSSRSRDEIDLVVHAGVYRTEYLSEPALAAIAAGELKINHDDENPGPRRTLAFDLMCGAAGSLTASFLAAEFIAARKYARILVLASEVENNTTNWPENPVGVAETASAFILERGDGREGFVSFGYRAFPELVAAMESFTGPHNNLPVVVHQRDPNWNALVSECVRTTVADYLRHENLTLADLKWVLPPQAAPDLRKALAEALAVPKEKWVDLGSEKDLFTSSLAHGLASLRDQGKLARGDKVLLFEVAAGVQVLCALYQA